MHSMPTLLPGSLASGMRMFANDYLPMAAKKVGLATATTTNMSRPEVVYDMSTQQHSAV